MRIVIEVNGDKVTAIRSDEAAPNASANVGDVPPGPPPAALLERAKKLGAMSAGAAQFGVGAALASTAQVSETPKASRAQRAKKAAKKRARTSR